MSWKFLRQFRELGLGVCFGISMLVGSQLFGFGFVYLAYCIGIEPTWEMFVGGICVGMIVGGAWWKLTRFIAERIIAAQYRRSG